LSSGRLNIFNSIGFIGLVVFFAVVLTSLVFSSPAPVRPPVDDYLAEWSWLMQAQPPAEARTGMLLRPAVPKPLR
jgi:hypothetical protein